jgi:hypothetical protein
MDVEISLHDFKFQRPNRGLSTLIKISKTFLNIIYNGRLILKYSSRVYRFWKTYYTDTLSTLYDGLHMKVHLGSSYMVFSQLFSVVDRYDVV